jgi:AcrR family transcriptional regulator
VAKRQPAARDTRERILEAALVVFAREGYSGASIDEIAALAGATKGAVYYYFEDKDDLARDLQRGLWQRLAAEALGAFEPGGDAIENLERGFDAYLAALQQMPVARHFLRESWAIPSLDDTGVREEAFEPLRMLIDEGVATGELTPLDPDAVARILMGMYAEATLHILTTGEPGPTVEVVRRFVHALEATPAERKRRTRAVVAR